MRGNSSSPGSMPTGPCATSTALADVKVDRPAWWMCRTGSILRPRKNGIVDARRLGRRQAGTRAGRGLRHGHARSGQLPPRRDRRAQRRRLQRRRLPRHAERQERLQAVAARLRSGRRLPAADPRPVRPPHRQARPGAKPRVHEGGRPRAARGRAALRRDQPPRRDDGRAGSPTASRTTRPRLPPIEEGGGAARLARAEVPREVAATRGGRDVRRRRDPRRDAPDGLQQQRPVDRRRHAERAGRVQAAGRSRHPLPLPRRADLGAADLPRAARGLRLDATRRKRTTSTRTSSPSSS